MALSLSRSLCKEMETLLLGLSSPPRDAALSVVFKSPSCPHCICHYNLNHKCTRRCIIGFSPGETQSSSAPNVHPGRLYSAQITQHDAAYYTL